VACVSRLPAVFAIFDTFARSELPGRVARPNEEVLRDAVFDISWLWRCLNRNLANLDAVYTVKTDSEERSRLFTKLIQNERREPIFVAVAILSFAQRFVVLV